MITLKRIINFAWKHFWRNAWLSFITITVMTISILAINVIIAADHLKVSAINYYSDKLIISVALRQNLADTEVNRLVSDLQSQPFVAKVEVLTPEENKERVTREFPRLKDAFNALPDNPLSYRVNIQPKSIEDSETIINYLQQESRGDLLGQKPELEDSRNAAENFVHRTSIFNFITSIVAGIFLLFALQIVYNTVRISLYTQRDEVGIMKLVGATNSFIRAPFIIEAAVSTLVSVLLATILFFAILQVLTPTMAEWFKTSDTLMPYFVRHGLMIAAVQFVSIFIIQVICVFLALRRYLRV